MIYESEALVGDFLAHIGQELDLDEWLLNALEAHDDIKEFAQKCHRGNAYGHDYFRPVEFSELVRFVVGDLPTQYLSHAEWLARTLLTAASAVTHLEPKRRCAGIVGRLMVEANLTPGERERFERLLEHKAAA